MHSIPRPSRPAFTVMEILIVVVIVGILAALVIPQFVNAGDVARRNSLVAQLQNIRTQIASYKADHNQQLPNLNSAMTWQTLTDPTTGAGNKMYGPYLDQPQVNPLNGLSTVFNGSGAALTAPYGWVYDYGQPNSTGKFWATDASGVRYFNDANPSQGDLDTAP